MAFFLPRTVAHSQGSLHPFFHLASIADSSSSCGGANNLVYRPAPRPWSPKFTARETEEAYILRGELPGFNRDHVTVEFPEQQELVVRGRVERGPEPATTVKEHQPDSAEAAANEAGASSGSQKSYQATVEDDDDFDVVDHALDDSAQKQAQHQLEKEAEAEQKRASQGRQAQSRDTIREFARTFTLPAQVDPDFATADLKDGLLTIVVPKAKPQPHRVAIN